MIELDKIFLYFFFAPTHVPAYLELLIVHLGNGLETEFNPDLIEDLWGDRRKLVSNV